MKTAISVPDDVFEAAERLARRSRTSRSELYSRALNEYIARHSPDQVTEAMNATLAEIGDQIDQFGMAAAVQVLSRAEW
jgi:metal-responsive CopG/Arc/MetJ family transcriptional regulator